MPLVQHSSWGDFLKHQQRHGGRLLGFSRHAKRSYLEVDYREDDWLIFGCETRGLAPEVREDCDDLLLIPMTCSAVRSLNLSVAAAVVLFEARRQLITG